MPHYLLTGAGFSRNWGGWLVDEVFEYLLGAGLSPHIKKMLWAAKEKRKGFEDVLGALQGQVASSPTAQAKADLDELTSAVALMFHKMGAGYSRTPFEFTNDTAMMVRTFLQRFAKIYTLNQDDLIEQQYMPLTVGRRCLAPGVKGGNSAIIVSGHQIKLFEPDTANFNLPGGAQPYIKLHGSANWMDGKNRLLIVGGNKSGAIQSSPLLSWYQQQFIEDISQGDAKLMILGYSFGDDHINEHIKTAVHRHGLRLFIIDPKGVDILDKRDPRAQIHQPHGDLYNILSPSVIGASRRQLGSTFNYDRVEHEKIMQFFV